MTVRYDPPTVTGGGLWAGTKLLRDRLRVVFPELNIQGGYNPRCVQFHPTKPGDARCQFGHRISHHAECRALDLMTGDQTMHRRIVAWCLDEGQRWGTQEIITGFGPAGLPQRWAAGKGWALYVGPSNHRDHVHLSQTIAAASATRPPLVDPPKPPDPPTEDDDMSTTISRTVPCGSDGKGWAPLGVAPDRVIGEPWVVLAHDFREALPEARLFTATDGSACVHVTGWFPGASIEVRARVA